jgi:hypothetical protein
MPIGCQHKDIVALSNLRPAACLLFYLYHPHGRLGQLFAPVASLSLSLSLSLSTPSLTPVLQSCSARKEIGITANSFVRATRLLLFQDPCRSLTIESPPFPNPFQSSAAKCRSQMKRQSKRPTASRDSPETGTGTVQRSCCLRDLLVFCVLLASVTEYLWSILLVCF